MVEKQLAQQTQILAIHRILQPINLKHSHLLLLIPIHLVPWRMEQWALLRMSLQLLLQVEERQAELTNVEAVAIVIVDRIGGVVPGL